MRSRATSIVLVAALISGLTGCTFFAPQTVQQEYDPSDGVGADVGSVQVRNALLISADGEDASLVVSLINSGDRNQTLVVSWENQGGQVDRNVYLQAGGVKSFGAVTNQIVLNGIDAELGGLFPVYFQYGDEEGEELRVPVLDGSLPEYSDLLPGS